MTDSASAHSKLRSDSRRNGGGKNSSENGGGRHNSNGNGRLHSENGSGRYYSNEHVSRHHKSENEGSRHNSRGSSSRHNSESEKQGSTPTSTGSKSNSNTPARPGSALSARQTNSTPRLRSRPAPVRSLSSSLGRSLSMRVSKKEKRWSLRLADPTTPMSTTYRDDYQSPEQLALSSLNLETTTDTGSDFDPNLPTTYRQSFRWQSERNLSNTSNHSEDANTEPGSKSHAAKDTPNRNSQRPATISEVSSESVVSSASPVSSSSRAVVRNGQVSSGQTPRAESARIRPSPLVPGVQSPTSEPPVGCGRPASFYRRNDSSGVKYGAQSLASTDTKSSPSPTEKSMPFKPACGEGKATTTEPTRGNRPLVRVVVSGAGSRSPGTPSGQKLTNGVAARGVVCSNSQDHTPWRSRAYQLQSSNGGSPFTYGSDSGYWV